MKRLLPLLISLNLLVTDARPEGCFSYGDLRRWENLAVGLVQIYMGPDGSNMPEMWGMLDGTEFAGVSATPIQKTLCQQLGYKDGVMWTEDTEWLWTNNHLRGPPQVWLSNISCSTARSHIFQCDYNLNSDVLHPHSADIHVHCIESTNIRSVSTPNAYLGEVTLFPPEPCTDNSISPPISFNYSPSFGIVAIRQAASNWMYLQTGVTSSADIAKEDVALSHNDADTICRSAGYTHSDPNSAMTVQKAENVFHYSFSTIDARYLNSKYPMKNFSCSITCPCLYCCLPGNTSKSISMQEILDSELATLDSEVAFALVIRCVFYRSAHAEIVLGSEHACKLNASRQLYSYEVCSFPVNSSNSTSFLSLSKNVVIGVGVVGVVVLLCLEVMCVFIYHGSRRRKRADYMAVLNDVNDDDRVDDGNDGNNDLGNRNPGNGGPGNGSSGNH